VRVAVGVRVIVGVTVTVGVRSSMRAPRALHRSLPEVLAFAALENVM
jgi:hypothetical protein